MLIVLVLVTYIPALTLWLPRVLGFYVRFLLPACGEEAELGSEPDAGVGAVGNDRAASVDEPLTLALRARPRRLRREALSRASGERRRSELARGARSAIVTPIPPKEGAQRRKP